ncbi:hypothetical protein Taro_003364, partial [Colocasia esculenta]|nr:hypothetical protein [Colocasia esculenta]
IPAPKVVGDRNGEAHFDVPSSYRLERAGKGGWRIPPHLVMMRQMRRSTGPIVSGGHASLPGGSPLLRGVDDNESSSDCLFLEIVVMDDGASAFAELGVSTKQYSFALVEAYIPMPFEEYSATESTPASDFLY